MSTELREALTAANAAPLINKVIDPILLEYQRRFSPIVTAIPTVPWDVDVYNWNQRTRLAGGGFVVDGGAQAVQNSTYVQNSYQIKHLQVVGAVTGYSQAVTRGVIGDLRRQEILGSIQGMTWDIETGMMWGNSTATLNQAAPQFDGLDTQVATFTGGNQNAIDKAGASLSLATLDEIIDMVETNAAMSVYDQSWMFALSATAISRINQLLVNQQRFNDKVEIAAGLLVDTYRNIPLVRSSFLQARGFSVGTVTTATGTTGGSLPNSTTYKYQVSAIIARQGEIAVSAEVSQATGAGTGANTITLSFTPPTGLEGNAAQLYKVYRTAGGGATGTETFLGYVDATVGFQADGVTPLVTTSIVDTGTNLLPQNGSTVPANPPATYVGTNANLLPPGAGQENIYLMSRDRNFVVRPKIREYQPLDIFPTAQSPDTLPYAIVTDTCFAVRAPKYLGRAARVGVSL